MELPRGERASLSSTGTAFPESDCVRVAQAVLRSITKFVSNALCSWTVVPFSPKFKNTLLDESWLQETVRHMEVINYLHVKKDTVNGPGTLQSRAERGASGLRCVS